MLSINNLMKQNYIKRNPALLLRKRLLNTRLTKLADVLHDSTLLMIAAREIAQEQSEKRNQSLEQVSNAVLAHTYAIANNYTQMLRRAVRWNVVKQRRCNPYSEMNQQRTAA